ncbi:MAG TPA: glutathione S-transferase N-terminal domain-containing protein [Dongiaceae bacterium]
MAAGGKSEIEVYTWPTPNGHKLHIALEELGLAYRAIPIDIAKGEQFKPEFLSISPNNKIPAILDPEGPAGKPFALSESGAILIYLAEKTGSLWPKDERGQSVALQWLCFQMAHIGPMLGQVHHFRHYAPEQIEYAIARYTDEAKRLYGVLDRRLGEVEYLTAGAYGMSDIAVFPWLLNWEGQGVQMSDYPHVHRWYEAIAARPAVQRGVAVLAELKRTNKKFSDEERAILFGAKQYERR